MKIKYKYIPKKEREELIAFLDRRLSNAIKTKNNETVFEALHDYSIKSHAYKLETTNQDHILNYLITFEYSGEKIDLNLIALMDNLKFKFTDIAKARLQKISDENIHKNCTE
ncbi:hypothetical protein PAF38_004523 [Salmonella enterica]|nr:hypothetical protein [Salmonella enterica]EID4746741.1 hypothetical protein [Salmonella enterica]EIK8447713.1 hypothetical protein [Salmonella enterica]EIS0895896.1 hypothetical protein [Salmonella enterica]EIU9277925.1 hypothetical protein [Salmonella enterica]